MVHMFWSPHVFIVSFRIEKSFCSLRLIPVDLHQNHLIMYSWIVDQAKVYEVKVTSTRYPVSKIIYLLIVLFFFSCHERILRLLHPLISSNLIMRTRIWTLSSSTVQKALILLMQLNHLIQLYPYLFWESVWKAVSHMRTVSFLPTVKGRLIQVVKLNWRLHMWSLKEMSYAV